MEPHCTSRYIHPVELTKRCLAWRQTQQQTLLPHPSEPEDPRARGWRLALRAMAYPVALSPNVARTRRSMSASETAAAGSSTKPSKTCRPRPSRSCSLSA
jgi:hypothetical protein